MFIINRIPLTLVPSARWWRVEWRSLSYHTQIAKTKQHFRVSLYYRRSCRNYLLVLNLFLFELFAPSIDRSISFWRKAKKCGCLASDCQNGHMYVMKRSPLDIFHKLMATVWGGEESVLIGYASQKRSVRLHFLIISKSKLQKGEVKKPKRQVTSPSIEVEKSREDLELHYQSQEAEKTIISCLQNESSVRNFKFPTT